MKEFHFLFRRQNQVKFQKARADLTPTFYSTHLRVAHMKSNIFDRHKTAGIAPSHSSGYEVIRTDH